MNLKLILSSFYEHKRTFKTFVCFNFILGCTAAFGVTFNNNLFSSAVEKNLTNINSLTNTKIQNFTITGKVTDNSGQPLAGANVIEKGTSNGTQTDFDGNFKLNVKDKNAVVIISFLGFQTKEMSVNVNSNLSISLLEDSANLDEVVLVGYTSQKKSNVTSSVAVIDNKKLSDVTAPDVSTQLQGKASGVQVVQSSGQPGSSPSIRIRGVASINGSVDPLWVVDGIIINGTPNINPNEIASISVLKDASATSLYGSRGSNGVILVSTKSGASGKSSINITSRTGFSKFNNGNFELMNSKQFYNYYESFGNQNSIPNEITPNLVNTDFNWFKFGTQIGKIQDHNISLTGGTEKSKTFLSLGYYNETGTVKGFDYDRVSFRLNHDYKVTERLTLKPKVAVNFNNRLDKQHSLYSLYTYLPWDKPYDANNKIVNPVAGDHWLGRDQSNYLYDLQYNYSKNNELNLYTNFDVEFSLTKNIKFISTNGITLSYINNLSYVDPKSNSGLANNGQLSKGNENQISNFTNQMFKYSNVFGLHTLNALIAYEYNEYKSESDNATGYGIVSGTKILDNAATPGAVGGTTADYALQSVLSNVDYGYADKYLAQFSIRRDGASNFGKDNQYGTFYSGSLGWKISNEEFFNIEQINDLKLRLSYGAVGNRPSALYPQYQLYSLGYTYNGTPAPTPSQLGNEDLKWEKSYQNNIGVDLRVFDRLNLTLEYYSKNTSDLLYFVTLPSTSGFTGYWENIGGVKNKGYEANAVLEIVKTANFNWDFSANVGTNTNKVTALYEDKEIDRGNKLSRVGEDFNTWFMRKWVGVDPANGNPLWEVVNPETGEQSNTSDYNAATKQIVGSSSPKVYGGFGSSAEYHGFSLSANFNFTIGGKIYNSSRELFDSDGAYPTYNQMILNNGWKRWEKPGDNATHPLALYGGNNLSNKVSSRYLEDGSYLRLRNIKFGYSIPSEWISQLSVNNIEIYFSGDNLLTLSKYSGTDPEVGPDGYAGAQYPISKRFAFGLNITF